MDPAVAESLILLSGSDAALSEAALSEAALSDAALGEEALGQAALGMLALRGKALTIKPRRSWIKKYTTHAKRQRQDSPDAEYAALQAARASATAMVSAINAACEHIRPVEWTTILSNSAGEPKELARWTSEDPAVALALQSLVLPDGVSLLHFDRFVVQRRGGSKVKGKDRSQVTKVKKFCRTFVNFCKSSQNFLCRAGSEP